MPRVHEIQHARKDYPESSIKKGDHYYKWSIKTGPATGIVYRSKTYPKPSQLTNSPFMSELLSIQEEIEGLTVADFQTAEDLSSSLDEIVSRIEALKDETQGSLDNMPESLQQGDVGQMIQARIDGLDSWVSDLQGIDLNFSFDEEEPVDPGESDPAATSLWEGLHDAWETKKSEAEAEFIANAIEEIQSMEASVE